MHERMDKAYSLIQVSMQHTQNDQDALESKTEEKTEQTKKKPSLKIIRLKKWSSEWLLI